MSDSSGSEFSGTDRYRIRRTLGIGGMGVVYEAWDNQRGIPVALKTLRKVDPGALMRFKREFRAIADVSHPNLVALYELVAEGEPFFTMELVEGADFLRWIGHATWPGADTQTGAPDAPESSSIDVAEEAAVVPPKQLTERPRAVAPEDSTPDPAEFRRPPEDTTRPRTFGRKVRLGDPDGTRIDHARLRHALKQLCDGVAALHGLGLLHRDIKPSNVLVTAEGRLVLLDLGLVTMMAPSEASVERYVAGTGAYMSPEQASARKLTEASDWYSVGVMLYEALTGVRPFRGNFEEVVRAKQLSEPPPPSRVRPAVPADLDALCTDLLRLRPQQRPSEEEILRRVGSPRRPRGLADAERAGTRGGPVFVGRGKELGWLQGAFKTAAAGHGMTVHLHGDSGMGKSALLRRFADDVTRDASAVVLGGRCYERESMPYKAIDSVIDSLSRFLRSLSPERVDAVLPRDVHALARVFPVLRQVEAIALAPGRAVDGPDPQQLRQRAFDALREFLSRIADRHPLVVAIDDLQWGDLDSVQLLLALTRPPDAPALLLVVSYRSTEMSTPHLVALRKAQGLALEGDGLAMKRHQAVGPVLDLQMEPLSAEEAVRLAGELVGSEGAERVRAVAAESRGSPFFVQELARYLLEKRTREDEPSAGDSGWLERAADTAALDLATSDWAREGVAEGVRLRLDEVMQERLGRLSEDARALLETVAVAGRPLPRALARRAASLPGTETTAVLALRQAHLVRSRGTGEDSAIEPYHDRIREAVLASLPNYQLRERHLRLALALEGSRQADPEALTEHFCGAGHLERAGEYAEQAAEQAGEALAFDRASMLYRLAIRLRPPPTPMDARRLMGGLATVLANAGRSAEAAEAYREAAEATTGAEALELRRLVADHLLRAGHFDEGIAALRLVLSEVGMRLPDGPRAALVALLARRARLRLRGLAWTSTEEAELPARDRFAIDLCWSVAAGLAMADPIRGSDFQTRSLLLALNAGEPKRVARALAMEGAYLAAVGGNKGAKERAHGLIEDSLALAESLGLPEGVAFARTSKGVAYFEEGRWSEARAELQRAEELLVDRCTGVAWELATTRHFLCLVFEMMGDLAEFARRVPEYVRDAEERGDRFTATSFRNGNLNLAWLVMNDVEGARRAHAEAMAPWYGTSDYLLQHYEGLYAQVAIDLYVGDGGSAWLRIEDAWPALRKSGLLNIQQLKLEVLFLKGRAAILAALHPHPEGDLGVDRDPSLEAQGDEVLPTRTSLLSTAARIARRIEKEKMGWAVPLALLLRAGVAAGRERWPEARSALASAAERLEAVDMRFLATAVRYRLAQVGGPAAERPTVQTLGCDPDRLVALFVPLPTLLESARGRG